MLCLSLHHNHLKCNMKRPIVFIFIIVVIVFTSCSPIYYVPNTQEIPLFTEKNQGRGHIGLGNTSETSLFKISGAYSFSKHFGITGNVFLVSAKSSNGQTKKGASTGLGLVHFLPVDENFIFESTLGFASGKAINEDIKGIENEVRFVNFYCQPSIGQAMKHFEMIFSLKYNIHTYTKLNSTLLSLAQVDNVNTPLGQKILFDYPLDKTYHFLEPALTIRFGWESVKLHVQFVYSSLISQTDFYRERANINFGINFKFGNKSSSNPEK